MVEDALKRFAVTGTADRTATVLRPGFIHGTKRLPGTGIPLPLSLVRTPMEFLFRSGPVHSLKSILPSIVGDFLVAPSSVQAVAKVAVDSALREGPPAFEI